MLGYLQPKDGPVFEGLEDREIVFAKHQPQYIPLRAVKSVGRDLTTSRLGRVYSRWTLTDEQRQVIANGGDVILELMTFHEPLQPIRMMVVEGQLDPDWVRVCLLDENIEENNGQGIPTGTQGSSGDPIQSVGS